MADILVIDDEAMMIELIGGILTDAGHTVRSATDGATGLTDAVRRRPDLVVLDMKMPGLDGFAVARRLRATPATHTVPILAVTAIDPFMIDDTIYAAGCSGYVAKPLDARTLLANVDKLLTKR